MDCTICYETINENDSTYTLPCNHTYHTLCINQWFSVSSTCPMCRQKILTIPDSDITDDSTYITIVPENTEINHTEENENDPQPLTFLSKFKCFFIILEIISMLFTVSVIAAYSIFQLKLKKNIEDYINVSNTTLTSFENYFIYEIELVILAIVFSIKLIEYKKVLHIGFSYVKFILLISVFIIHIKYKQMFQAYIDKDYPNLAQFKNTKHAYNMFDTLWQLSMTGLFAVIVNDTISAVRSDNFKFIKQFVLYSLWKYFNCNCY